MNRVLDHVFIRHGGAAARRRLELIRRMTLDEIAKLSRAEVDRWAEEDAKADAEAEFAARRRRPS